MTLVTKKKAEAMKAEPQGRRKIVVVEDDTAIRDLLRVHLELAGGKA